MTDTVSKEQFYAMTPYERVAHVFDFGNDPLGRPLVPTHKQRESVDLWAPTANTGCWDKPGTGKTLTMTMHAAHAMCTDGPKQWVVLTPPSVIVNWVKFLQGVTIKSSGNRVTAVAYLGTPAQRQAIDLGRYHFLVMSYEVFKRDYGRLTAELVEDNPNGVGLICDEGHRIKNLNTDNYRCVKGWHTLGVPVKVATGTPTTTPADIYTYTRIKNPDAYRNYKHFCDLHVEKEDAYEKVTAWKNLPLARQNHMVAATETLLSDVRKDMPPVLPSEWPYELDPKHMRLYRKLAEEQVVIIESTGEEITALNESALFHRCQQLVLNWSHFSGDPRDQPRGLELAEQWLDELGDEKLIIVANYKMTNKMLLERLAPYGSRLMFGEMTHAQKMRAKDDFIEKPEVRVLIMQPESGGVGVDGLQHVCHSMLFLESPSIARQYHQAVARVDRTGQVNPVQVRIAVAAGTVQVRGYNRLLANDDLVAQIQRTPATLRDMIYGAN